MSSAISASQVEMRICDLSPPCSTNPHGVGNHNDPLRREKTITLPSGEAITEYIKLCRTCYDKARQTLLIQSEATCDLSTPERPHTIDIKGLRPDPMGRIRTFTLEDGSVQDTEEVMKLCRNCYDKAQITLLIRSGATCALSTPESPHKIDSRRLLEDPLGRKKKITRPDGSEQDTEEVMKLCFSCCAQARKNLLIQSGAACALSTPESLHKIDSHGLVKDPLGRKKTITLPDGSTQTTQEVMKLCFSCYKQAFQTKLIDSGAVCALSAQHKITKIGLLTHPGRLTHTVKQLDGTEKTEIMQVCQRCATSIRKQLKKDNVSKNTQEEEGFVAKRKKRTAPEPIAVSAVEPQEDPSSFADEITNIIPIKEEPLDVEDPDCQVEKTVYGGHEIDNTLPILQALEDPNKNVLRIAEKNYPRIKVTNWGALAESLSQKQKEDIQSASLEWIRLNEKNREEYTRRLEELCEVTIPVDEDTPYRGRSVFAKRTIQQYEVIGPYAGAFLGSEKKLTHTMRKEGSLPVESYLFQTAHPTHTIHGFNRGNVLSLINTGSLIGQEEIAKNNLVPIVIGKHIIMIVATEEIPQGKELFLDYGPDYQPGRWIKTED